MTQDEACWHALHVDAGLGCIIVLRRGENKEVVVVYATHSGRCPMEGHPTDISAAPKPLLVSEASAALALARNVVSPFKVNVIRLFVCQGSFCS